MSAHWIGRTPDCYESVCEFESTLSTFIREGVEYELWECRHCGRGEDRRVYEEDDYDPDEVNR